MSSLSGLDDLHNEQSLRNDHLLCEAADPLSSLNGSNCMSRRKATNLPIFICYLQHFQSVEFLVGSCFAVISQQFAISVFCSALLGYASLKCKHEKKTATTLHEPTLAAESSLDAVSRNLFPVFYLMFVLKLSMTITEAKQAKRLLARMPPSPSERLTGRPASVGVRLRSLRARPGEETCSAGSSGE